MASMLVVILFAANNALGMAVLVVGKLYMNMITDLVIGVGLNTYH